MLEANFRRVTPYTPGAQPRFTDMIKLNTNENPYPPSPAVAEAALGYIPEDLRLYPPVDAGELRKELAAYHGVRPEQVFVGIGSDDVLSVIFQACFNSGRPVLFPDITYSFYEVWADMYRVPYETVALKEDFTVDVTGYERPNGGIVIANPNAPTGIVLGLNEIRQLIASDPERVVVVDEAYIDFGGESALPLLDEYENLLVVRTYSKSRSMAGLRIGYAIAAPEIISALETVKFSVNSYTLNRPAIMMGCASLKDETYFCETRDRIIRTRARMTAELERLGFTVLPSGANFVFASHSQVRAERIFSELMERHIFVRHFDKPRIDNFLRITVGTEEQTDKLIEALTDILGVG